MNVIRVYFGLFKKSVEGDIFLVGKSKKSLIILKAKATGLADLPTHCHDISNNL